MTRIIDTEQARHEFVSQRLAYVNDYIRFADTKAALILTGCSFLFALPLTKADELAKLLQRTHGFSNPYFLVLAVFLQAALIFTVVHCVACIYPRLGEGKTGSNVAFPGIAGPARASDAQRRSRLARFLAYVKQLQPAQTTEALTEHLFWLSTIAVRKYIHVQRATIGLALVLLSSIMTTLVLIWLAQQ